MVDTLFFRPAASPSLLELAEMLDLAPPSGADSVWRAKGLASLSQAGPDEISFCAGPRHEAALATTRAGAVLLKEGARANAPAGTRILIAPDPNLAFARLGALLYPDALRPAEPGAAGIAPSASIDRSARLEPGVAVAPAATIGRCAEIGTGTVIGPHAVIGEYVRIGRDCTIASHVTIGHALIGDRVIIHAGARLGQDGFGFVPGRRGHRKIAQLGRVIIQDDVEIGANATIDRGALDDTMVGEGTKIDNLVHIAHNVVIGRHCFVAAQSGIAGSTVVGDFVAIGGQAGISGHLAIGRNARIAGQSGVVRDVPMGLAVAGSPAGPAGAWLRQAVRNACAKPRPE